MMLLEGPAVRLVVENLSEMVSALVSERPAKRGHAVNDGHRFGSLERAAAAGQGDGDHRAVVGCLDVATRIFQVDHGLDCEGLAGGCGR